MRKWCLASFVRKRQCCLAKFLPGFHEELCAGIVGQLIDGNGKRFWLRTIPVGWDIVAHIRRFIFCQHPKFQTCNRRKILRPYERSCDGLMCALIVERENKIPKRSAVIHMQRMSKDKHIPSSGGRVGAWMRWRPCAVGGSAFTAIGASLPGSFHSILFCSSLVSS